MARGTRVVCADAKSCLPGGRVSRPSQLSTVNLSPRIQVQSRCDCGTRRHADRRPAKFDAVGGLCRIPRRVGGMVKYDHTYVYNTVYGTTHAGLIVSRYPPCRRFN